MFEGGLSPGCWIVGGWAVELGVVMSLGCCWWGKLSWVGSRVVINLFTPVVKDGCGCCRGPVDVVWFCSE